MTYYDTMQKDASLASINQTSINVLGSLLMLSGKERAQQSNKDLTLIM